MIIVCPFVRGVLYGYLSKKKYINENREPHICNANFILFLVKNSGFDF